MSLVCFFAITCSHSLSPDDKFCVWHCCKKRHYALPVISPFVAMATNGAV